MTANEATFDDIVARVNAIQDPVIKARARARLLRMVGGASGGAGGSVDLATQLPVRPKGGKTGDGRKSFKRQGKWGHGFVPLDEAAKQSKAKGSPIARKRIERIFNRARAKDSKPAERVTIKNDRGGTETANSVAQTRTPEVSATTTTQRAEDPDTEKSKGGQIRRRSDKAWGDIPDEQKVIRNGKRYVMTTFQGKQQLTQWFGPNFNFVEGTDLGNRRLSNLSMAQASKMSTAMLRSLLRVPGQPAHVKTMLRKAMNEQYEKNRSKA